MHKNSLLSTLICTLLLVPAVTLAQDVENPPDEEPTESDSDSGSDSEENREPEADSGYEGVVIPEEEPVPPEPQPAPPQPAPQPPVAPPVPPTIQPAPPLPPPPTPPVEEPGDEYQKPTLMSDDTDDEGEPVIGDEEDGEHKFSWFSLAPEVGYTYFFPADMTVKGLTSTVDARNGFVGKVHLDLGGDGFAFELAPLFSIQAGGIDNTGGKFGSSQVDLSSMDGSFKAVGGEMSMVWRFKLKRFYPNLGIGFHGAYVMGDGIDYGAEIYGRIPVGFTVYLAKHLGLVVEAGLMIGVTGIKQPINWDKLIDDSIPGLSAEAKASLESIQNETDLNDWIEANRSSLPEGASDGDVTQVVTQNVLSESIRYGFGLGLDLMIGLRFP